VWDLLAPLTDPEIPVITLRELGILREVRDGADGLQVVITPTYSGCPAMGQIEDDVKAALDAHGIEARIITQLSPFGPPTGCNPKRKRNCALTVLPPRTQDKQSQSMCCSL